MNPSNALTRPRAIRPLFVALAAVVLLAVLFPIFAGARAYGGPSALGVARGVADAMEGYFLARPEPIGAWSSRSGPPVWLTDRRSDSIDPQSWPVVARRLSAQDAELEIASTVVGRHWLEITPDEPVLIVHYGGVGGTRRAWIAKSGRRVLVSR